ncbi:MAG TPA: hypothetical protein VEF04_14670 [Blastocatellia bacterium]|nr:hypothetical protein [Blastocatellia bacterium]
MGRTVQPFSQVLSDNKQRLGKYRRALRAEDQQAFDDLFEMAHLHISAGVYAAFPDPSEAIYLSVLIEQHKLIKELRRRVRELEGRLEQENH